MYHGIINVYKERGYTSHDVVAKLRGILGQKKIGHTGTLDPDAEGVLPVCLGTGTRLCDMLTERDKVYEAGLLLGITTDTLDITGTVTGTTDWDAFTREEAWKTGKSAQESETESVQGVASHVPPQKGWCIIESETESVRGLASAPSPEPVAWLKTKPDMKMDNVLLQNPDEEVKIDRNLKAATEKNQKIFELEERICEVLSSFVGKQMQVPPMYSALKVNGKKLVDLARTGVVLERKPREIEIYSIRVLSMDLPHIRLLVHCGKGTYIRSLCDDIGRELGCGGCMESLIRRAVGPFQVENAKTLGEITELRDRGELERYIIPPDEMFDYPSLRVMDSYLVPAKNGNPIPAEKLEQPCPAAGQENQGEKPDFQHFTEKTEQGLKKNPAEGEFLKIYLPDGRFLGIYRWSREKDSYVPEKIFLSQEKV